MGIDYRIIVVEDDASLRTYLKELLLDAGYSVRVFGDGISALKEVSKTQPDLVILDLGLPTMGGETVCKEIKKITPDLPVIILTARNTSADLVKGFNLGADDYIGKPFEIDELLARIKARLRQNNGESTKLLVDDLSIDSNTLEVKRGARPIHLTPQEFKLLKYLIINKGKVLTRDMILNRIWLYSPDIETRVVDVYIGYLRSKIDKGFRKKLIHSVRGFGYVLKE